MTVKTSISLSDRHHGFVSRMVAEGIHASASAAIGVAIERMIEDEQAREAALAAMADEIRRRMATPLEDFVDVEHDDMFDVVRARLRQQVTNSTP